jgi:hypothetical protein
VTAIEDFPTLAFRIGTGETKSDCEWLKKKKEFFEKLWIKEGPKILRKIEDFCNDTFTNTSKEEGMVVLLHKKGPGNRSISIKDYNPLEMGLFLSKNDTTNFVKEQLVNVLTHSFIQQKYQFHFRIREQTLFEDILADEFVSSMVSLMVLGKKMGRSNCEKALDEAVQETVNRLSQKETRSKLLDVMSGFSQEYLGKVKSRKLDILEEREELVSKLLKFLPETISDED